MRYFNRIIIAINTLLFIAVGVFFVSVSVNAGLNKIVADNLNTILVNLNTQFAARFVIFTVGAILLLIALLTIIGNIQNKINERTVVLQSPLGDIMVSLSAIEDFSKIIKNQVAGIKEIRGRVTSKRKGLNVTAWATLYSDRSVADATQEIQEAIIQYIKYTLGIETEIKPRIIVSKVVYKTPQESGKGKK